MRFNSPPISEQLCSNSGKYRELTLLKVKLNASRVAYNDALNVSDKGAAADALKRWKFVEQELLRISSKCDRRRGPR
jgi:hypothetical protein